MNSQLRLRLLALGTAALLVGGCASKKPAPVRDGTGAAVSDSGTAAQTEAGYYTVRPGDTLMGISRQFGQNVRDLTFWNNLSDPNQIHVGQQIRVAPPDMAMTRPISGTETPPLPTAADARPAPSSADPPPLGVEPASTAPANTPWIWPASGRVIEAFSDSNKGIDITGALGDPVMAAGSGSVVYSGAGLRGYGNLIIIKHDDEYLSAYAHNQKLLVKEGESVRRGQRIAEMGNSDADRPKLHFEIRRNGKPVDPMRHLPKR
jgi:lipoprotein NlpD